MFKTVKATAAEKKNVLPGDQLVADARIIMDRAMTLPAPVEQVWPWLQQMGKNRGGWYFTRRIEWMFVKGTRGIRFIDQKLQDLAVGKVIDDWGGKHETFTVDSVKPGRSIVYTSVRRGTPISWAVVMTPQGTNTRVHFRLRIGARRPNIVLSTIGGWFDGLTIKWLRDGLCERLTSDVK